jgi:hypothetical protein
MIAMDFSKRWIHAAGAVVGFAALAFTVGCNTAPQATTASAQPLAQPAAQLVDQAGTPVVVSCEPHQRTLVRPAVVNGTTVSQVECVAAANVLAPATQSQAFAPVGYRSAPAVRTVAQPVYSDLGDAQVVPVRNTVVRPVRTNQVVYDERPVRRTRTVAKSAIIIGSSAGVGAGVGAAVGGKKGALIGAAIGGGGATIWDQVTRRK